MNGNLRPLADADLDDLLRWRNHPRVRRAMINQHRISRQEHLAWWAKTRMDGAKQWCIYQENGEPMAVVNFSRLNAAAKSGWWGFYLCDYSEKKSAQRAPLARRVMQTVLLHARECLGLRWLLCEVLETNLPARRLYDEHGFQVSSAAPSVANIGLIVLELRLAPEHNPMST